MSDDKTKIFSAMRARTQENIARQKAAEYTPTTDEVREDFAFPWGPDQIGDRPERVKAFDRWKAENDRQVAAKALTEFAAEIERAPWANGRPGLYFEGYEDGRKDATTLARTRAAAIVSEPSTPEQPKGENRG